MAVDLIKKTFSNVKNVKVGMQKPESNGVYAKNVYNVFPQFDAIPQKVLHVMNDDKAGLY